MVFHNQISTGFLTGSIIVALLLAIDIVAVFVAPYYMDDTSGVFPYTGQSLEETDRKKRANRKANRSWARLWGGVAAVIILGITGFIDFPFSAPYHEYQVVSGKVQSVESRLIASNESGGGTTQVFPVQIGGQTYKCDDTRCAQLKPGSDVTLLCIKEWEFNGTPGFECNWGKLGLNR